MTTATIKSSPNRWTLRLFTLLVWLLVGLCAAYWAFKFVTTKSITATAAMSRPNLEVDSKAIAKMLGATDSVAAKPSIAAASTKFVLFGLAATAAGRGVALIALDGKPAKPYRVGSLVADDLLLKSISKTGVVLAASLQSPDGVTLDLPARKPPNTAPNSPANMPGGGPPPRDSVVPTARIPAPSPNVANQVAMPSFAPVMPTGQSLKDGAGFNGANPGVNSGVNTGAAAAISRFAPQNNGQTPEAMVPGRFPPMPKADGLVGGSE
jgi:general secretion pathway protein C